MAQYFYEVEKGFSVTDAASNTTRYQILHGSGAPGGDTGEQDDSPVGSIYIDYTNGYTYQKRTDTNDAADWFRTAVLDDVTNFNWRSELIRAATGEAAIANDTNRNLTTTPLTDDDGTTLDAADFTVGEYILFGVGGTPVLKEVTVVSAPNIQVSDAGVTALSDNDMMVVRNYLPDSPDGQELEAIVLYNGTDIVKIADFNFAVATGIDLSGGYTPGSGNVTPSDTVESAIQKIDGNVDALTTTVGVSQGDTDMGTYTGTIITDNQSAKQNIQELETDLDALQTLTGMAAESTDLGTFTGNTISDNTTIKNALQQLETKIESGDHGTTEQNNVTSTTTTLDSVVVDTVYAVKWFIHATDEAGNALGWEVWSAHNGHAGADATQVDYNVTSKLKVGNIAGVSVDVDINGAGGAQVMRLRVTAGATATDFRAKRLEVIEK